ncbi:MAG TPA: 50S ribosomal protein L4 [Acholeplasma sp.]|jgi:large subunit ribosomal protein L4|nr:50S ribosomal protein L4 [Acholeplasmatales bacterium]HHV33671.1 50S ribosomal protein L4 [Acholeplasma sp.]
MLNVKVLNQSGKEVSKLTLNEQVFGIEPNTQVLYDVVNAQRAAMRQGTHSTKTRTEVSGGGKKPYRQKGTGRARHGSSRSPVWRGGGVTFGPTPEKNYKVKVNRKVSELAYKSILSLRLQNNQLVIVDKLELNEPKTKQFQEIYNSLVSEGRAIFIDVDFSDNVIYASRNIPTVRIENASHTSVYDLTDAHKVVLTTDAVKYFEEALVK